MSSDAELVRRIAMQDAAALAELYDRYSAAALALAVKILNDRAEGEDTLQKVFLNLWREAFQYDSDRGSVSAWLFTSIRNSALDTVRRRGARRRYAEQAPRPASPSEGIETGTDTRKRVADALQKLPPEQREPIELAYFQGMSQTEIAERLGRPLGTVKTRMRLGMIRLKQILIGRPAEGA